MKLLVFPNQLFIDHPGFKLKPSRVVLIEDSLFFGDSCYPLRFHKQKLWLHRATMKRFEAKIQERGMQTQYIEYDSRPRSLRNQLDILTNGWKNSRRKFVVAEPNDFMLEKRLQRISRQLDVPCEFVSTPGFINFPEENQAYRAGKNRWHMADFYKFQRKRLDILMDGDQPMGGKWSFDEDNRKKVPKKLLASIPEPLLIKRDQFDDEAIDYVQDRFGSNPGSIENLYYPTSHADAQTWLQHFLDHRVKQFGDYEDAIEQGESWLWHSVLTPMLNIGLLTPREVVQQTVAHAAKNDVPLNSLEGFLRQVIGWREFIRATYQDHGVEMRTTNHWNHHRPMPAKFYDGTTGVLPVDDTIRRVLDTGYCHHIERLMVLSGFMFLCEIDPDAIYNWFMEMFVDSYDWVMVPNVYAMGQHADGGLITTKPYFSGSSYVRKMSHYRKAPWCDVWDGLYWRWVWIHSDELAKNPRWAMMCSMAKRMDKAKRDGHVRIAEQFLEKI